MGTYFSLQRKKITKSKLTVISVVILLIFSLTVLYFNSKDLNGNNSSIKGQLQGNIMLQKNFVAESKRKLSELKPTDHRYQSTKKDLKEVETSLAKKQKLLEDINNNHWVPVYEEQIRATKELKKNNSESNSKNFVNGIELRFKYLKAHPMPYESDTPVSGIQILLNLNETYWPILLTLVMIFILTYLYTGSYRNGKDITMVLPIGRIQSILTNASIGWICGIVILLGMSLLVFACASLFFGTGNIAYPYIIHQVVNGKFALGIVPVSQIVPNALILQIFAILFIAIFTQLIAKIFRNQLPSLLLTILLLIGGSLITIVIQPLNAIAQWLPSTYLNPLKTVSGTLAYELENVQVNFGNGMLTLIISSCFLIVLLILVDYIQTKNESKR